MKRIPAFVQGAGISEVISVELSSYNSVIHFRSEIGGLPIVCAINPYTLSMQDVAVVTERHSHSFFELLYIEKGRGALVTDERTIGYGDNFACLIVPYVYHTRNAEGGAGEFLSIKFEPDKRLMDESRIQQDVNPAMAYLNARGVYSLQNHERLRRLFEVLTGELRSPRPCQSLVLGGLMSAILSVFLQEATVAAGKRAGGLKSLTEESSLGRRAAIIDCFFDHVENVGATMEDLCQLVHISPGQLNRIIKAQYGKTFKQKLIDMRIEYIKHLLAHTDYSIPEITAKTNFSSEGNLSQFFKTHYGCSPTAYRLERRKGQK